MDVIEPHDYVRNNVECIKTLSAVKTSFLLPQTHPLQQYEGRNLQQPASIFLIGGETKRQVIPQIFLIFSRDGLSLPHLWLQKPRKLFL